MKTTGYATKIPAQARARCTERLTYAGQIRDLVDAHLKSNQYFGSFDKTLAGFYILDSTGDDYTLLDLREPNGHVYFQDHDAEYRNVYVRWASLADYAASKEDGDAIDALWSLLFVPDKIRNNCLDAGYLRRVVLHPLRAHLHTREIFPRLLAALATPGDLPDQLVMEELTKPKLVARLDKAQNSKLAARLRSLPAPGRATRNWTPQILEMIT